MQEENKIINGLWIGTRLSPLEMLCIRSFVDHGHQFNLWTYNPLENSLPVGTMIRDANQIIPWEEVFQYRHADQFGHGKGSYAGFSDIFRYKLLYEKGGWWVDMDVTCLRPLDFTAPYVFRTHQVLSVVGNIMKCPPASELMKRCYEKAVAEVGAGNRDWNKPIWILIDAIRELGLTGYIVEMSNADSWNVVRKLVLRNRKLPPHWFVIHWVNEEWRRNRINKNYAGRDSILRQLYVRHNIILPALGSKERIRNRLRLTYIVSLIKILPAWAWGQISYFLRRDYYS